MSFLGVELPENIGEAKTEVPVETKSLEVPKTEEPKSPSDVLELDKLERFRFGGKEWTPKDLNGSILRHEDYTRKTMEVAEARKYADNFSHDLQTVLKDSSKFAEFEKIYPKEYVQVAKNVLSRLQTMDSVPNQQNGLDSKVADRISQMEATLTDWQKAQHAAEVQKYESWLDNTLSTLSAKYPMAETEIILARAQALQQQGHDVTKDGVMEKLFKATHEATQERFDKLYKEKTTKQLEANSKGKDIGTGGGIPTKAPRGLKTMKEAKAALLEHVGKG